MFLLVPKAKDVQKSAHLVDYWAIRSAGRNALKRKGNVKRKYLMSASLLVMATLVFAGWSPLQAQRDEKPLITVLNPAVESKMVDRVPLPPRMGTLEGKTIYMLDINWGGPDDAYSIFEEITS